MAIGRVFYGWWIVGAGATLMSLMGALWFYSFGAYFVHLQAEFGWSRTMLGGAFALAQMQNGVLAPFQGWLLNKMGPRMMIHVGVFILCGGFFLFSHTNSTLTFYIAVVLIATGTSLMTFMPLGTTVMNWFDRNRAQAMGVILTGLAVGGFFVPGIAWVLEKYGWRTMAVASSVIVLILGTGLARIVRKEPEPYGYLPDGVLAVSMSGSTPLPLRDSEETLTGQSISSGFGTRDALKTKAFWFLSFGHAFSVLGEAGLIAHLIPHLVEKLAITPVQAGGIMALLTVMTIVGYLGSGYFGNMMTKHKAIAISMLGSFVGLMVLAVADTVPLVALGSVVFGMTLGLRLPQLISIRADYFGRRNFPAILGFSVSIVTVGAMGGPLLAGLMADHFGTYQLAFVTVALLAVVGAWLFYLAEDPRVTFMADDLG